MAETKEIYVTGIEKLDFILARIADRLDALEGLRGSAIMYDDLQVKDEDGETIHKFGIGE